MCTHGQTGLAGGSQWSRMGISRKAAGQRANMGRTPQKVQSIDQGTVITPCGDVPRLVQYRLSKCAVITDTGGAPRGFTPSSFLLCGHLGTG